MLEEDIQKLNDNQERLEMNMKQKFELMQKDIQVMREEVMNKLAKLAAKFQGYN